MADHLKDMHMLKPPSNLVECTLRHLIYICDRVRPNERDQFVALGWADDFVPDIVAHGLFGKGGPRFTCLAEDNTPAIAGGYEEIAPDVWQSWMIGTPEGWVEQWRNVTRASKWVMAGLFRQGARRLQTSCIADRADAIRWYEKSLGLRREGVWRQFGKNGEDVAHFARVRED
ncbi:hypothetical protein [Lysobacter sp. CA199]|uniref:hypothetical protein n=1 Tax=Lysobacter sp. CA199 TaxID=3455608 RepID=UPI003F8D43FD